MIKIHPSSIVPAFLIIILTMIGLLIFSAAQIQQSNNLLEHTIQVQAARADWSHELQVIADRRSFLMIKILDEKDPFHKDELIQQFYQYGETFMKTRKKLTDSKLAAKERDLLQQQVDNSMVIVPLQHQIIDLSSKGNKAAADKLFFYNALPYQQLNNTILNKLVKIQSESIKETINETILLSQSNFLVLSIGGMLIILGGGIISILVYRNLTTNIKHLSLTKKTLNKILLDLENQQYALNQHAIVSISDTTGAIIHANDKFCETSQYSYEELIGKQHNIINSGYHDKTLFRDMWTTISSGRTWQGEIRNKKKDGTFYWVETTIVPFLDNNDLPYQYVAIRTEITHIKKIESELKFSLHSLALETEKSQQSNKLKESIISTMTHELRTPLNAILGFSQLLLFDKENLTEAQIDDIHNINESGNELLYNIDNIMLYSKLKSQSTQIQRSEVELHSILQTIIDDLKTSNTEQTILPVIESSESIDINVDINLFRKAILYVIENAIKFTKHGSIGIHYCAISKNSPLPAHDNNATSDLILITIRDTGVGISPEKLQLVFDEFRQADEADSRKYEGFGIGLSVTRSIISLHEGEIWLTSKIDEGTTVYITIPITSSI